METTVDFLDSMKARHGLTSDYQLAKHLKIRPNRISNYRQGVSLFDEETCLLIAADLKLDPGYVFACIAAERANKPEVKAAWKHTAEILGGLAAALAILAILPFAPLNGVGLIGGIQQVSDGGMYIMSNLPAVTWLLLIPLALLAIYHFPRSRSPGKSDS